MSFFSSYVSYGSVYQRFLNEPPASGCEKSQDHGNLMLMAKWSSVLFDLVVCEDGRADGPRPPMGPMTVKKRCDPFFKG